MARTELEQMIFQMDVNLAQLNKKLDKMVKDTKKSTQDVQGRFDRLSTDIPKAMNKIFDSSKSQLLGSASARIGVLGAALEDLGPYGLAAAGAITALWLALSNAREAVRFADDIGDLANNLHVSTDELQAFRYANRLAGGDIAGADQALGDFNITLGKAQAGIPKALKPFKELGFSKNQVDGFATAGGAIDAIVGKLKGLSAVQQDAVISQFGLSGLKPLLESGVDQMEALRRKAFEVGYVMDSDLIKRAGEFNDKFETVTDVIDVQLKSALIDLAPILLNLLGMVAQFAKDIDRTVQSLQALGQTGLSGVRVEAGARRFGQQQLGLSGRDLENYQADQLINYAKAKSLTAASMRAWLDSGPSKPSATSRLADVSGGGSKQSHDRSAQDLDRAMIDQLQAQRTLLQALESLTDDVETRQKLQRQMLDLDAQIAKKRLAAQVAEVNRSQDSNKAAQIDALNKAAAEDDHIRAIRLQALMSESELDLQRQLLDRLKERVKVQIDLLQAQKANAGTAAEAARIQKQIDSLQDKVDDAEVNYDKASRQARSVDENGNPIPLVGDPKLDKMRTETRRQRDEATDIAASPLASFIHSVKDLRSALEDAEVNGIQNLNQGIAELITQGGNARDVLKNIVKQFLADLINANLQSAEGNILNALHIPKHANGTMSAPGGLSLVGERGPELVDMPQYARVFNATDTRSILSSVGNSRTSSSIYAPLLQIGPDASGMLSDRWIEGLNGKLRAVRDSAVSMAMTGTRRSLPAWQKVIARRGA